MPVTDDTVRYAGTARGRLDRVVDGVVRDVTAAYSRALLRMLPDWQATVQRLTDDGGASGSHSACSSVAPPASVHRFQNDGRNGQIPEDGWPSVRLFATETQRNHVVYWYPRVWRSAGWQTARVAYDRTRGTE